MKKNSWCDEDKDPDDEQDDDGDEASLGCISSSRSCEVIVVFVVGQSLGVSEDESSRGKVVIDDTGTVVGGESRTHAGISRV